MQNIQSISPSLNLFTIVFIYSYIVAKPKNNRSWWIGLVKFSINHLIAVNIVAKLKGATAHSGED